MDSYYSFNYLTTSEQDSDVLLTLITLSTNIFIATANEQLAKDMEELSAHEQAAGPSASTLNGDRDSTPTSGRGTGISGEVHPTTQGMELVGETSSASVKLNRITEDIRLSLLPITLCYLDPSPLTRGNTRPRGK